MQHDFAGSPVAQDYGRIIGVSFKVFLSNGVSERTDPSSGKTVTEIVDLPGLISSILVSRVLHPRKLSGDDLKYIRSVLRMKSNELAKKLDVSPEHYSRCEGGMKALSPSTEKLLRMYVFLKSICNHVAVQEEVARLRQENAPDPEEIAESISTFENVFFGMKIEHIFDPKDELAFYFVRAPRDESPAAPAICTEDGKWRVQVAA